MVKLIVKIIVIFARVLRYVGYIGFLILISYGLGLYEIPASFELPLGDLKNIAVDSDGNIYCGSKSYHRIQVYNPKGHFLYGIPTHTDGAFWIRINNNDQLEVALARGDKRLTFDKNGKLIRALENVPYYDQGFNTTSAHIYHDPKRNITYEIKPIALIPFLGSNVVRTYESYKDEVIIRTPFLKWLFMAPSPSMFFVLLSLPISFIFDQNLRDRFNGEGKWKEIREKEEGKLI